MANFGFWRSPAEQQGALNGYSLNAADAVGFGGVAFMRAPGSMTVSKAVGLECERLGLNPGPSNIFTRM